MTLDSGFFLQSGIVYEEKFRNDGLGYDYEIFNNPYPERRLTYKQGSWKLVLKSVGRVPYEIRIGPFFLTNRT